MQFLISFVNDQPWGPESFDLPPLSSPDRSFLIPASEVAHVRLFELVPNTRDYCVSTGPAPTTYYENSATLPVPVNVVAGRRYWIEIAASIGQSGTIWGWRVGRRDNGRSKTNVETTPEDDLAFRLTE